MSNYARRAARDMINYFSMRAAKRKNCECAFIQLPAHNYNSPKVRMFALRRVKN